MKAHVTNGTYYCPCGKHHSRGAINGLNSYRCLSCGETNTVVPEPSAKPPSRNDTFTLTRADLQIVRDLAFMVINSRQNVGTRMTDQAKSVRRITDITDDRIGQATPEEEITSSTICANCSKPYSAHKERKQRGFNFTEFHCPGARTVFYCPPRGTYGNCATCDCPFEDPTARFFFHKKGKATNGMEAVCCTCSDIRQGYQPSS